MDSKLDLTESLRHSYVAKSQNSIYTIEDCIEAILSILANGGGVFVIFHAPRYLPRGTKDIDTDVLYFFRISFVVAGGVVVRFSEPSEVAALELQYQSRADFSITSGDTFTVYFENRITRSIRDEIVDMIHLFIRKSDYYENYVANTSRVVMKQIVRQAGGLQISSLFDIAKLIRQNFGLGVAYFSFASNQTGREQKPIVFTNIFDDELSRNILSDTRIGRDLALSHRHLLAHSGCVEMPDHRYYYKIIPMWEPNIKTDTLDGDVKIVSEGVLNRDTFDLVRSKARSMTGISRIGAFALVSRDMKIDRVHASAARDMIKEFTGSRVHWQKMKAVSELYLLQNQYRNYMVQKPLNSHGELRRALKAYGTILTRTILFYTVAHSASIRLYDPFQNNLRILSSSFVEQEVKGFPITNRIGLEKWDRSVNAFTFVKCRPGDHVYVRNVDEIDEELGRKGLRSTLRKRQETKSELCLPIFKNNVPVGTLNVEAPFIDALEKEVDFCSSIAAIFAQFFEAILLSSDAAWIPLLALQHYKAHQLIKLKRSRNISERQLARKIDEMVKPFGGMTYDEADPPIRLRDVVIRTRRFARHLLSSTSKVAAKRVVVTRGAGKLAFSGRSAASIQLILSTLVENAKQHSRLGRERICIRDIGTGVACAEQVGGKFLEISYSSLMSRELKVLQRVGISPIWSSVDRTHHFGMFLIGLHTRMLGGQLYVDTACKESARTKRFRIVVHLPTAV
jgi:hypothetical protein